MKIEVRPKSHVQNCETGCPVELRYEVPNDWNCDNNGIPETECTDWVKVLMEVQTYQSGTGEMSSCDVNGINVNIAYKFWYEPQLLQNGNFHLTTPNSLFKSDTFDASLLKSKTLIKYLGQEYLVWDLKNWIGGCYDDTREAMGEEIHSCEEPTSYCGLITLQEGMLVPYKDCKRDTLPSEPEQCIGTDSSDDWVKVSQLLFKLSLRRSRR